MTIEVYSKKGCKLCKAAKDKLAMMGADFKTFELASAVTLHEGWREDDTVEIMAGYAMIGNRLPLIRIEGEFHSYPSAMRRLKGVDAAGALSSSKGAGGKVH